MIFTEFQKNWHASCQQQFRISNAMYKKELTIYFRHLPCYENTSIMNYLFEAGNIECCKCRSILEINNDQFEALKFI